jgi:uncharacterized protein (DUF849 family)
MHLAPCPLGTPLSAKSLARSSAFGCGMVSILRARCDQAELVATVITEGGHVRVGMEDNPFVRPGEYARSSAELIEKMVRIARELGREVASPDEAK